MSFAYFTVLCSNDDYINGVLVLAESLKKVSKYPFYCIVSEKVDQSRLDQLHFFGVTVVEAKISGKSFLKEDYIPAEAVEHLAGTVIKLDLWKQTQFSTIVYLDADTFVLSNPDDLFNLDSPFSACHDLCPDSFNSGVMVIKPSLSVYNQMQEALSYVKSYDGADQGFLNKFFNTWFEGNACRLNSGYNAYSKMFKYAPHYILHLQQKGCLKVAHFLGDEKPWRTSSFDNESVCFKDLISKYLAVYANVKSALQSMQKNEK